MAYSPIWGYGSVRFQDGTYTVTLGKKASGITYTPILQRIQNDNYNYLTLIKGWYATISVELINDGATDYQSFLDLIKIINGCYSSTTVSTFELIPNYSTATGAENWVFNALPTSPISFDQISLANTGQTIKLSFECPTKFTDIPVHTTTAAEVNAVFETSDDTEQNAVFETANETEENAVFEIEQQ